MRILIIDDDKEFVESLSRALGEDSEIVRAHSFDEANDKFEPFKYDVILLDIRLDETQKDKKGLELLKIIKTEDPDIPVLIMTAYGDIDVAVESLKLGADDFIQKNKVSFDDYKRIINNLSETGKIKRKISRLESRLEQFDPWKIVGENPKIKEVRRLIKLVAEDGQINVLIRGETGTGKELVARAIHQQGVRKDGPYIVTSLASLNKETISSDLFGHEKGAFTGAISRRIGLIEQANNGILFLDEIGELEPAVQVKLLRVLETKEFTRLGGNKTIKVDVQWIMATHRDLKTMMKRGELREDFYYRLKTFEIYLPPLRERKDDIPLLCEHFLGIIRKQQRTDVVSISEEALEMLMEYDWPGNVRELKQTIEYSTLRARLAGKEIIEPRFLPEEISKFKKLAIKDEKVKFPVDISKKLAEFELRYIEEALRLTGKKTEAWKILGYPNRFALRRKVINIFKKYPELRLSYPLLSRLYFENSKK